MQQSCKECQFKPITDHANTVLLQYRRKIRRERISFSSYLWSAPLENSSSCDLIQPHTVYWTTVDPFTATYTIKWHTLPVNSSATGLKVSDQLVVHATRFLIVRLKTHVWSHKFWSLVRLNSSPLNSAFSPDYPYVLQQVRHETEAWNNKSNRRYDTFRFQTIKLHHFPWISMCLICCFSLQLTHCFQIHLIPFLVFQRLRW